MQYQIQQDFSGCFQNRPHWEAVEEFRVNCGKQQLVDDQ